MYVSVCDFELILFYMNEQMRTLSMQRIKNLISMAKEKQENETVVRLNYFDCWKVEESEEAIRIGDQ